jgi:hypothetical protein
MIGSAADTEPREPQRAAAPSDTKMITLGISFDDEMLIIIVCFLRRSSIFPAGNGLNIRNRSAREHETDYSIQNSSVHRKTFIGIARKLSPIHMSMEMS